MECREVGGAGAPPTGAPVHRARRRRRANPARSHGDAVADGLQPAPRMFEPLDYPRVDLRLQDRFGPARPEASAPQAPPAPAAHVPGGTGRAPAGVLSPTAEMMIDEPDPFLDIASLIAALTGRPPPVAAPAPAPAPASSGPSPEEEYRARRAAMDARDGDGPSFLQRALARLRGDDHAPIEREPGAPAQERPLRDPETVIAEAMATASRPAPAAAPEPERPYSGLSPEEEYRARRAALDAREMPHYQRAMARAGGAEVDDPTIAREPGAPAHRRPLRDPQEVIAEAMATAPRPTSTPVPPPERPYSGLSPEEEYRQRRAMLDARYGGSGR
jgi:hypothetical protein